MIRSHTLVMDAAVYTLLSREPFGIDLVISISILVFAVLVSTFALTMGLSVVAHRRDRHREQMVEQVRTELLDRLNRDDPGWASWVAQLDEAGEEVVVEHVEMYLDMLIGSDREQLLELADALALLETAREAIENGDLYDRCRGLRLLDVLGESVEPSWLMPRISTARMEREAAAPVLRRHPDGHALALGLLLDGEYLTGFGLETLSELVDDDPIPTVERLQELHSTDLLAQVLLVLSARQSQDEEPPIDPIVDLLDHEEARIRARACLVLGTFGWRDNLKQVIDIDRLLTDVPEVRIATYRMLAGWRDETARRYLRGALDDETDRRARIVLVRSLVQHGRRGDRFALAGLVEPDLLTWANLEGVASLRGDSLL